MEEMTLTEHARIRMTARRIPVAAVEMALLFGRERRVKGATYFVIGRKEVERFQETESELGRFEGVHVVCAEDDVVMTAYRNRDFSGLRPRRPRKGSRRREGGRISPWFHGAAA